MVTRPKDWSSDISAVTAAEAPAPVGHYVQALVFNGLIYVLGQLPSTPDGAHAVVATFEDQVARAIENLFGIVRAAGGSPEHILKVTACIVGVGRWPIFNHIYKEAFGSARPARTVVPVPELHHGYLIEIDAIAARSSQELASPEQRREKSIND